MSNEKKVTVSIYCKIFTDNYPYLEGEVTGDQIVNHLLSDCNCVWETTTHFGGAKELK